MAERQGFEPWVRFRRTTVFETAAFDHSATSPVITTPLNRDRLCTCQFTCTTHIVKKFVRSEQHRIDRGERMWRQHILPLHSRLLCLGTVAYSALYGWLL